MKTNREAFEEWARNDPERDFDLTADFIGGVDWYLCDKTRQAWNDWREATEACDAHWRDKLQSDDFIKWKAEVTRTEFMSDNYENIPDPIIRKAEAMRAALAAISKEMGAA
jgi:hypothetical protein